MGDSVRYDGKHRRLPFLAEHLSGWVEWVSVCPELQAGLGVPRPPMRLEATETCPRLRVIATGEDLTGFVQRHIDQEVARLMTLPLSGFVLTGRSPSCGVGTTPIYDGGGNPVALGSGLFAHTLQKERPLLPIADDSELTSCDSQHDFLIRIFAHHRWLTWRQHRGSPADLAQFHERHRLQLEANSPEICRQLDACTQQATQGGPQEAEERYGSLFARALALPRAPKSQGNTLARVAEKLGGGDVLRHALDSYRLGALPLVAVLLFMRDAALQKGERRLSEQTLLEPYPHGLMLRLALVEKPDSKGLEQPKD